MYRGDMCPVAVHHTAWHSRCSGSNISNSLPSHSGRWFVTARVAVTDSSITALYPFIIAGTIWGPFCDWAHSAPLRPRNTTFLKCLTPYMVSRVVERNAHHVVPYASRRGCSCTDYYHRCWCGKEKELVLRKLALHKCKKFHDQNAVDLVYQKWPQRCCTRAAQFVLFFARAPKQSSFLKDLLQYLWHLGSLGVLLAVELFYYWRWWFQPRAFDNTLSVWQNWPLYFSWHVHLA